MSSYTVLNLKKDVEDQAPKFGYAPNMESRFARAPLELENSGLSHFKIAPEFRLPFGHTHSEQEEVYLVLEGSARFKLDDEIVELKEWDVIRVPSGVTRGMEGGPDGAQILAFGAPNTENKDLEMLPGWWSDDD
jgi:mannose-6-phosphate isomerase-like protein (cupin superfamily)